MGSIIHLVDRKRVGAQCEAHVQGNTELTFEIYEVTCDLCAEVLVKWRMFDSIKDFRKEQVRRGYKKNTLPHESKIGHFDRVRKSKAERAKVTHLVITKQDGRNEVMCHAFVPDSELTRTVGDVDCVTCLYAAVHEIKLVGKPEQIRHYEFLLANAQAKQLYEKNQETVVGFAYEEESVEHTVPEEDPSIRDYREELGHIEKDADGKRQEINELLGLARRQLSIWEAKASLARDTIARLNELLGNDHRPATAEKKFR